MQWIADFLDHTGTGGYCYSAQTLAGWVSGTGVTDGCTAGIQAFVDAHAHVTSQGGRLEVRNAAKAVLRGSSGGKASGGAAAAAQGGGVAEQEGHLLSAPPLQRRLLLRRPLRSRSRHRSARGVRPWLLRL